MMRKTKLSVLILTFIFSAAYVYGLEEKKESGGVNIPPSMEIKKEGNLNFMAPKDGRLRKDGSMVFMENSDEYASRKFSEIEKIIKNIEKELEAQKNEIWNLKKTLEKIENRSITSEKALTDKK